MGNVRDPLLRPSRTSRGVRPAARGRGAPASALARALLLALAISALAPSIANADTLTLAQYRERLDVARRTLVSARALPSAAARAGLTNDGRAALRATSAITIGSGSLAIDDSSLADFDTSDASLDNAIARLNTRVVLVSRLDAPSIDPATADARLRDVVRQSGPAASGDLFELLGRLVVRFLSSLNAPRIDPNALIPAIGLLGLAVILFIVATLGRALPERVRTEVLVRDRAGAHRDDPLAHLRAADAAIVASRPRDAIRELFLYAVTALTDRDAIRYDPALTDRELVVRAAAIPHADAFRALVGVYEQAWFGMREPSIDESRRARELALRVAP